MSPRYAEDNLAVVIEHSFMLVLVTVAHAQVEESSGHAGSAGEPGYCNKNEMYRISFSGCLQVVLCFQGHIL